MTSYITQNTCSKMQEATPLKTGSGQELRQMYSLLQLHTRALKASGKDHLEVYLTIAIKLNFDEDTKLKWIEYSCYSETMPSYEELLRFLDI